VAANVGLKKKELIGLRGQAGAGKLSQDRNDKALN
jgi:hypothetical protein